MYAVPSLYLRVEIPCDDVQMLGIASRVVRSDANDRLLGGVADDANYLLVVRGRQMRPAREWRVLKIRAVSVLRTSRER